MSRDLPLLLGLVVLPGCAGEITAIAALIFSMSLGAWLVSRRSQRRALLEAVQLRRAIATGRHREIEQHLRRELALAAAGEAVSDERQWLARAQLGGLLVAEWRLAEAREIYTSNTAKLSPHLQALAAFGRHELDVLTREPDEAALERIRGDRDNCLRHVPGPYQSTVARTWAALEGLCLSRMGRPREAAPLLDRGVVCLGFNPARVKFSNLDKRFNDGAAPPNGGFVTGGGGGGGGFGGGGGGGWQNKPKSGGGGFLPDGNE